MFLAVLHIHGYSSIHPPSSVELGDRKRLRLKSDLFTLILICVFSCPVTCGERGRVGSFSTSTSCFVIFEVCRNENQHTGRILVARDFIHI